MYFTILSPHKFIDPINANLLISEVRMILDLPEKDVREALQKNNWNRENAIDFLLTQKSNQMASENA